MSRIIVKNLPKTVSDESLRRLFSEKKDVKINDVQLKYTKDGKFRQIAFVGFATEAEAQDAIRSHHNTFVGTGKIKVELCKNLGDVDRSKAWSKHTRREIKTKESVGFGGKHLTADDDTSKLQEDNKKEKVADDPLFAEFLAIHANVSNKAIWKNDGDVEEESFKKSSKDRIVDSRDLRRERHRNEDSHLKEHSDEEETDDKFESKIKVKQRECRFMVTMRGLPFKVKKSEIKKFLHPAKTRDVRVPKKTKGLGFAELNSAADVDLALGKNRSFLLGHQVTVMKFVEKDKVEEEEVVFPESKFGKLAEDLKATAENIAESGFLFLRNLSFSVTVEDLEALFKLYGPLSEVRVPIDRFTRQPMGFAFVVYMIPEHAFKAYTELDGTIFQGRLLHILPGKDKGGYSNKVPTEDVGSSFKTERDAKQKAKSGSSHNWNALFLGANAVADTIATNYDTTKQDLFDPQSNESMAVRLALGETQLVIQTRTFLLDNGIDLDCFSQPASERSKKVILVKNLPAATKDDTIQKLFSKYGEIERVIMPPAGVTAVVVFSDQTEANRAFKNLAYSKFNSVPLYLEWAPVKIFKTIESNTVASKDAAAETNLSKTSLDKDESTEDETAAVETDADDDEDDEQPEEETILFVKNVFLETTEESLRKHFEKCGRIHSTTISTKKDLKNPGVLVPLGYGFVQYKRRVDCQKAMKFLQLSVLDGQSLELKISHRTVSQETEPLRKKKTAKKTKQKSTKILVRNIPFEANKTEIEKLFRTFGELKFVRLPLKISGSGTHRGFAFVDFVTRQDAKRAFEALCHSTHLYGRRLVLEWAETDDSVDTLRRKTAEHFHEGNSAPSKRSRKAAILEQMGHGATNDYDDDN